MYKEAKDFIELMYHELGKDRQEMTRRLEQIYAEIQKTGTYWQTSEELTYGAKVAWRNSNRCIGRAHWNGLNVVDARDIADETSFIQSIEDHIVQATNNGKIKPYITIYHPDHPPRIYNNQLIRYAGYDDCGDPMEREVTQLAEHLGWQGPHTDFDVLPLIYQMPGGKVKYHEYPPEIIKEVPISHPQYPKLELLNLRWYAVPIISSMDLKIGGITYPTVPFNGWYKVTEIGVRNFTDSYRYNLLEQVAHAFELGDLKNTSFNKDRALVELNYAVYHSFRAHGVSMVDHLTAAKQFETFERNEHKRERDVTGKWSWLAPPLSPTLTRNYHHGYSNEMRDPNFHYKKKSHSGCPIHS